jgi:hypothetical protein
MPDGVRTPRRALKTKNDLRCFCSREPLLAVFGLDVRGSLYVHVMIHKQHRIYANLVVRGGPLELQCRECLRWHVVNFTASGRPEILETQAPQEVGSPPYPMESVE